MISPEMRGAWRELERKLRPFVERRVSGPDADDVLQDVFLRMQRGLAGLREEERFGPWVYQVARSAILDHRRRTARRPVDTDEAPEGAVPAVDVEETALSSGSSRPTSRRSSPCCRRRTARR
jgi:RNA polymerase sigma-70 factor (ECF subfamily)